MSENPPDVESIVDEFTNRLNGGEWPTVAEYVARYPALADDLRELLSMVLALQPLRSGSLPGEHTLSPSEANDRDHRTTLAGRPAAAPVELPQVPGFEILEELGRGGMGVVYKARQLNLNREVALKMILAGDHAAAEARVRFLAEAELIARLRHPHIVEVFEFGTHQGRPFFALEYVPGGGLDRGLSAGPLPFRDAAALVADLARAVGYAHDRGVIHRDLKPANILLGGSGAAELQREDRSRMAAAAATGAARLQLIPKVSDFGLAKQTSSHAGLTETGALLGTPSYMAPEQAAGAPAEVTPAVDVYALGAVLYECLTGRPPFRGANVFDTLDQVRTRPPVPVRELQPSVPRDLETICLKCLEKDPRGRYASAAALASDLDHFLAGKPIAARPVGAVERAWRWCRRNPAVAGLLGGVLALMLLITVGSIVAAARFRDSQKRAENAEAGERDKRIEADENLHRAVMAEHDGEGKLWRSYRDAAAAARYSGRQGQRFRSVDLLAQSAAIARRRGEPEVEIQRLRDEAAACLCLPDVRVVRDWPADPSGIGMVVVDPGQTVLTRGLTDGTVKVWRTTEGGEVAHLRKTGHPFQPVAFSPDGTQLLVREREPTGEACRLWCWDWAAGREVWDRTTHANPLLRLKLRDPRVAYSPDGHLLAVVAPDGRAVDLIDPATGVTVRPVPVRSSVTNVAFAPDGERVAAWGASTTDAFFIDVTAGRVVDTFTFEPRLSELAWTREGARFAVTAVESSRIYYHQVGTRLYREVGGLPGAGNMQFSFARDENLLLTKANTNLGRLWRADRPESLMEIPSPVSGLRPDGRQFIALADDRVQVVEVSPAVERRRLAGVTSAGTYNRGSFHPSGRLVALRRAGATEFFDPVRGRWIAGSPFTHGGDFVRGGTAFVAPATKVGVGIWPVLDRGPTIQIGPPEWVVPDTVGRTYPSADPVGRILAVPDVESFEVFDVKSRARLHRLDHPNMGLATISPDGRWAVTVCRSFLGVFLWDLHTGRQVRNLHTESTNARAQFTADGRELVICTQDDFTFWSVATWEQVRKVPRRSGIEQPGSYAISPDSSLTAVLMGPEEIQLFDRAGRVLVRLDTRDENQPRYLEFSPDGGRLLVVHVNTFYIYDLRRIRAGLRAIDLDWYGPELPPDSDLPPVTGIDVRLHPDLDVAPPPRLVPKKKVTPKK